MVKCKRAMVTLRPEWETELLQLKKDVFYNDTQDEMFRQLIRRGLESFQAGKDISANPQELTPDTAKSRTEATAGDRPAHCEPEMLNDLVILE